MSMFEFASNLPLIKENSLTKEILTPKISFRLNPGNMKDHSSSSKVITVDDVFSINSLEFLILLKKENL